MSPDLANETRLRALGHRLIAGVDEAGRGPLAGPVVAAAVILPPQGLPEGLGVRLNDSKKMTAAARDKAFVAIQRHAVAWRMAAATPAEIDRLNILGATLLAMARAVRGLPTRPDYVLVDGNQRPKLDAGYEAVGVETLVKGDAKSLSIAAASVLAKVARDRIMAAYARRYPQWGYAVHKGYPTLAHRAAVLEHGPSPIQRMSFTVKGAPWNVMTGPEQKDGENPRR